MKQMVVIADPAGGKNTALKRALMLQARTSTSITILGFAFTDLGDQEMLEHTGLNADQMKNKVLESRRRQLEAVMADFETDECDVSLELIWGEDVASEIVKFSKEHAPDLVIKSGHRSETWLHTSTDWQLFRECPSPVMITAGKTWKKKPRILAAIDFFASTSIKRRLNDRIINHTKLLAAALNEEIHVACAVNIPQPLVDMDIVDPRKLVAKKRKELRPVVQAFCETHKLNPANVHIRQGAPDKVIPSISNSLKTDLVVAGTVGRKGVKAKVLGNTAEGILRKLHSDILTVKP